MHVEKRRAFIINFVYFLIIAAIAIFILKYAAALLSPFVTALLISLLLRWPVRLISEKAHLPYKLVAILTVILFFATVGTVIALTGVKLFSSLGQFVSAIPDLYAKHLAQPLTALFDGLDGLFTRFEFIQADQALLSALEDLETQLFQSLGSLVSKLSGSAMSYISGVATSLPGLLVAVIFTIVATFFISADFDKLKGFCLNQLNEKNQDLLRQIKKYVVGTLFVCIRSYAIILSITFVELAIGLSILRVRSAIVVALLIAVLDILPVVGTGTAIWPWSIISLIQGRYGFALGLIILYLVITVVRNIIEPKIVGGQLGLHPVVTLASMFAGAKIAGILGLFGFPIALSLVTHLNTSGIIKLFRPDPPKESKKPKAADAAEKTEK